MMDDIEIVDMEEIPGVPGRGEHKEDTICPDCHHNNSKHDMQDHGTGKYLFFCSECGKVCRTI